MTTESPRKSSLGKKKKVSIVTDDDKEDEEEEPVPWENFSVCKRKRVDCVHRVGPAPKQEWEESKGKSTSKPDHIGNLDCTDLQIEMDDTEQEAVAKEDKIREGIKQKKSTVSAGSHAIVNYFSRMGSKDNDEKIDYKFLHALLTNGAAVNVSDKYGQTVMHEVARNWNPDVAKFLMSYGADANHPDRWGRTPLHLAAATNHHEMVDYLLHSGANPRVKTYGEGQQVVHYAAKFNAVQTIKVLIEHKVQYNVRDYKGRTPLFLAAEMARVEVARYLLDIGDRVGIFDDTGMSAIAAMIEKMPQVACDALDQFQMTDYGKRKEYFFLNYLESNPVKWMNDRVPQYGHAFCDSQDIIPKSELRAMKKKECPTSALEIAVKHGELSVIMHPAMQALIKTKWELFGRLGASGGFLVHFIYVCLWTFLAVTLPRDADYYTKKHWRLYWRLPLEVLSVCMTFYFILKEIWANKLSYRSSQQFYSWRAKQINRDLEFCHPRWAQEKTYLESELKSLSTEGGGGLCNAWTMLECPTYLSVMVVIVTRIVDVFSDQPYTNALHLRAWVFMLIFLWLHFLKSCRPFPALGIFITMFGYAIKETLNFIGMFCIFSVPYTIGFWMIFGGALDESDPLLREKPEEDLNVGWTHFHEIMYFSWQVTLNVLFSKRSIMMDRVMAQMMLGTFYFSSTLLMFNMYIGLLTETFYKVYNNAKAYALSEQANLILNIEKVLSVKKKSQNEDYIHENCGPVEADMEDDEAGWTEEELWENVIRAIGRRFERFWDVITGADKKPPKKPTIQEELLKKYKEESEEYRLYQGAVARDKEIYSLMTDIYELKCSAMKLFNPDCKMPDKPKHKPLPIAPIKEPEIPPAIREIVEAQNKAIEATKKKREEKRKSDAGSEKGAQSAVEDGEEPSTSRGLTRIDSASESDSNDDASNLASRPQSADYLDSEFFDPTLNWEYPEDYYKGLLQIIEGQSPSITSLDRDKFLGGVKKQITKDKQYARKMGLKSSQIDDKWASTPELNTQRQHEDYSSRASSQYNRSTSSLQSAGSQSAFQSSTSLQSVQSQDQHQQQSPYVQNQDNALFRTIMNIKTSKIKYQMEPNKQNLHRILSMINEEDTNKDK